MAQNSLVQGGHPLQGRIGGAVAFPHSVVELELPAEKRKTCTNLPVGEQIEDNPLLGTVHLFGPAERLQRFLEVLV